MTGPLSIMYNGVSVAHGAGYYLLQIVGQPPTPSAHMVRASDEWKHVIRTGILYLREVFTYLRFTAIVSSNMSPANEIFLAKAFAPEEIKCSSVFKCTYQIS